MANPVTGSEIPTFAWVLASASVLGAAVAGFTGGWCGAYFTDRRARRREREQLERIRAETARALYHELADRAARSLNDYIEPWKAYHSGNRGKPEKDTLWLIKFRPFEPVIYPTLANQLGPIEPETLNHLVHFYYRLDALRRDIDARFDYMHVKQLTTDDGKLIGQRISETLEPALLALETLGREVPDWGTFDRDAKERYAQLRSKQYSLREGLKQESECAKQQTG